MASPAAKMESNLRALDRNNESSVNPRILKNTTRPLFFTSAGSNSMPLANGRSVALTGLYQCDFNDSGEENEVRSDAFDGVDQNQNLQCGNAKKVADGHNRDGTQHAALHLFNLEFDDSNTKKNGNSEASHLYANTIVGNPKYVQSDSWEIVRAKLPANEDGTLYFETFFRTFAAFDWNECNFTCCPYDSSTDDDPFEYSEKETNGYYAHTHAFVRTIPRSVAVDDHTGDIFVSWEGFYQNCDPANLYEGDEKRLEWTIGISRVRTEDPYCVTDQVNILENNFARCAQPVVLAFQSPIGRDAVLPHGGFAIIPAHTTPDGKKMRRHFLLSALMSPKTHPHRDELTSHILAVPEGGSPKSSKWFHEHLSLSGNGTVVDNIFMDANVKNGGTLRLHKNTKTGQIDHICRTIFNKGIGCTGVSVTEKENVAHIEPKGEEQIVLTEEQVTSFCKLPYADKSSHKNFERLTTLVTGLEVVWHENEDDGTGSPRKIIFGCHGDQGGSGNFGTIDVDPSGNKTEPTQVIRGAYPGSVLFLPHRLEGTWTPLADPSTTGGTDGIHLSLSIQFDEKFIPWLAGFVLVAGSMIFSFLCFCCSEKRRAQRRKKAAHEKYYGADSPYLELPTLDSSSETSEEGGLKRSSSCASLLHIHKD